MSLPVYSGPFGPRQAERLLWRAGFGPRPGQTAAFAALGLNGAVASLLAPGPDTLVGPAPTDEDGRPIAPNDAWGHDHLWWLDRMVRTSKPLVERMVLIWHDWFATSNDGVGSQKLMLAQNETFRKRALGSFNDLLVAVTSDPAMLLWLSGTENTKDSPNENYGREMMELFTLGADRPGGYTENDVREQARSLTGWRNDWKSTGPVNFRYDPARHDPGVKVIFGKSGAYDWKGSCSLCLQHANHPSFFVRKLWSYFVPTAPDPATQSALELMYKGGGYQVAPLLQGILRHPDLYGPSMVKPPVVFTAGILRALGRGIDTTDWVWLDYLAGQQLFYPPNVAGWDDTRWLDTASFRGRWYVADYALAKTALDENKNAGKLPPNSTALLDRALKSLASPPLEAGARALMLQFGNRALADATADWQLRTYPVLIYNAMRQLLMTMPEMQTC